MRAVEFDRAGDNAKVCNVAGDCKMEISGLVNSENEEAFDY